MDDELEHITILKDITGLSDNQIGRLFGVSVRQIQNWHYDKIPESHLVRFKHILDIVGALGNTTEERKLKLLSSSNGPSIFHKLVNEVPVPQRIQYSPLSVWDKLGIS